MILRIKIHINIINHALMSK